MDKLIGKILSNRYRIDDSLGRGGMAEVYKAWDLERATYLALKVLRQDLSRDVIFLRRFKREAQTLAKLQHPNIVRFYGIDRDELIVYILMDYIEGTTLQDEIFKADGRPCSQNFVLQVMKSVCSALHYAHSIGMVHCDIKPGNIMINIERRVIITDFGIARMTDATTATMVGFGTPAYMAPELVQGRDPTPQSDIYSLGVVLYEMVTGGERPFTGDQARTTGSTSEKVRWEQVNLNPPSPREYNPNLSPDIEAIIQLCLAKEPLARYSTAIEITQDIQSSSLIGLPTSFEGNLEHRTKMRNGIQHSINGRHAKKNNFKNKKPIPRWALWGACTLVVVLILLLFGKDLFNQSSNSEMSELKIPATALSMRSNSTDDQELAPTEENTLQPTKTRKSSRTPTSRPSLTSTSSIYITPTPSVYNPLPNCASSHLHVGESAFVSYIGGKNHVRTEPDTAPSNNISFDIYPGEVVQVIGGPECNYGWILWEIETTYNETGWTPESNGEEFWLYPIATRSICKDALPTRLVVGNKAKVNEEPPKSNLLREGPGRNYKVTDRIRPGRWMVVLEGPECGEAVNWWKVESLDTGTVGWTMEGNLDYYFLSPEP